MSRRKHPQEVHFGKKNNLARKGNTVSDGKGNPTHFQSIRQARRYMRTGRAHHV